MSEAYEPYLDTLRRVPSDVILAVATRNLRLSDGASCLCAWVVRETLARLHDSDAKEEGRGLRSGHAGDRCAELYGGTAEEWNGVYWGVYPGSSTVPDVERAFVERVLEAVNG